MYLDQQGKAQGPFPEQQMREWLVRGFFGPTLLVSSVMIPEDIDEESGKVDFDRVVTPVELQKLWPGDDGLDVAFTSTRAMEVNLYEQAVPEEALADATSSEPAGASPCLSNLAAPQPGSVPGLWDRGTFTHPPIGILTPEE